MSIDRSFIDQFPTVPLDQIPVLIEVECLAYYDGPKSWTAERNDGGLYYVHSYGEEEIASRQWQYWWFVSAPSKEIMAQVAASELPIMAAMRGFPSWLVLCDETAIQPKQIWRIDFDEFPEYMRPTTEGVRFYRDSQS